MQMAHDTLAWLGVDSGSAKVMLCLRRVVAEMPAETQLVLRDRRLQVAIVPESVGIGECGRTFRCIVSETLRGLFDDTSALGERRAPCL